MSSPAADRFRADLLAVLGGEPGGPLALAVSGGPDSMAMLWLAARAFPGGVVAATVDHRLRAEAATEAAGVARWCAGMGVPHATLVAATPPLTGNRHDWARSERYRLLGDRAAAAGAAALLTAHHADDQAETFLMRAGRGAGLAGLAAVRARRPLGGAHPDLPLVRPLLGWRRSELAAVAEAARLLVVHDPANADLRFHRARLRAWLAEAPWFDSCQVARSVALVAEAERELDEAAALFWDARARVTERAVTLDVSGLPAGLRRRLVRRALGAVDPRAADADLAPLVFALERGSRAMAGDVLVTPAGDRWRFAPAPPRRVR